jgi:hypothetical protein
MSDSGIFGSALSGGAAFRRPERTIAIDVGASATKAEISRGGFAVAEIAVNDAAISSFLDDLVLVQTKVVTQTIAAGTAVARGTAIDVVLAQTNNLPVAVIPNVHTAFTNLTMAQLHTQFETVPEVRDLVRTKTDPSQLTATERQTLTTALEANNVPVGTGAGETVESAFTALQAAFTFQA